MSTMTTNRAGEMVHPFDFTRRRRWAGPLSARVGSEK